MTRRDFTKLILAGGVVGWLGSVIYPVLSYLRPPKVPEANVQSVKAGQVSAFPVNTAQIVKFGRKPVILVRKADGDFSALAATCTHLGCIVQYRGDLKEIWCACHNGLYDLNGRNVSGPPPKPLEQYKVNIVGDDILVSRMA
ncbi:MAG TPA: Rieske (2Fe-2S) protein [Candidatus Krumholzibacteria bacterium]|nr:Rieske (2Fe-2S) protein [Candidatus Krumholzibacteria bacterium]